MKNSFCSATTLNGSAALPFVISTGAPKERSGEICGVSGPFLEMFFPAVQSATEGPRVSPPDPFRAVRIKFQRPAAPVTWATGTL